MRQRSVPDFPNYELFICDEIGNERNPSPTDVDVPDGTNLSFHFSGMIAYQSLSLLVDSSGD